MANTSFLFYAIPWYINIISILYVCYLFYYRIKHEEVMLSNHFGEEYKKEIKEIIIIKNIVVMYGNNSLRFNKFIAQ